MISCMCVSGVLFCLSKCSSVCMVSLMGTLVYKLVMSKDANVELCGMWMCWVFLNSSMSVSYTHLDVYKRQVLNNSISCAIS